MAAQEIKPLTQLHWDGKVLKNTRVSDDAPPPTKDLFPFRAGGHYQLGVRTREH